MRDTMIYPFSDRCLPLLIYFPKFQPQYRITALVSPPGLGLSGHTPFYAANRVDRGALLVQSDVESSLQQCDTLIVPFGDHKHDPAFSDAIEVMRCAAEMGKEIFCCLKITDGQRRELKDICRAHRVNWHDGFVEHSNVFKGISYRDYKIATPIVFIHNLGVEADTFEVTLALASRFLKDGYRVSVIGPYPEYNLLGFHGSSLLLNLLYGHETLKNIPRFIAGLQLYVHMVEIKENPDIILFHCPGSAVPMTGMFQSDCGVYTYLISRAIRPDFSLVCMAFATPGTEAIQTIHTELECQFGFGIDALHLSNRVLHVETTKLLGVEQHAYLKEESVLEKVCSMRSDEHGKIPVFNALSEEEQNLLCAHILKSLNSY